MKNIILFLIIFTVFSHLMGCTNAESARVNHSNGIQWDFDHQIQFIKTPLSERSYQLEMIPNSKVKFDRLASFLLRKSYDICGHYHYKLEIIQGIEGFDDKRAMPNYIFPSLIASVECKSRLDQEKK
jgi:hypothetical protein